MTSEAVASVRSIKEQTDGAAGADPVPDETKIKTEQAISINDATEKGSRADSNIQSENKSMCNEPGVESKQEIATNSLPGERAVCKTETNKNEIITSSDTSPIQESEEKKLESLVDVAKKTNGKSVRGSSVLGLETAPESTSPKAAKRSKQGRKSITKPQIQAAPKKATHSSKTKRKAASKRPSIPGILVVSSESTPLISEYNNLLVSNVEFFFPFKSSDNYSDAPENMLVYSVGLRCIHCKNSRSSSPAAVSFPESVESIKSHLETIGYKHFRRRKCSGAKVELISQFEKHFKGSTSSTGRISLKTYCEDVAKAYGVVDCEGGICWKGEGQELEGADGDQSSTESLAEEANGSDIKEKKSQKSRVSSADKQNLSVSEVRSSLGSSAGGNESKVKVPRARRKSQASLTEQPTKKRGRPKTAQSAKSKQDIAAAPKVTRRRSKNVSSTQNELSATVKSEPQPSKNVSSTQQKLSSLKSEPQPDSSSPSAPAKLEPSTASVTGDVAKLTTEQLIDEKENCSKSELPATAKKVTATAATKGALSMTDASAGGTQISSKTISSVQPESPSPALNGAKPKSTAEPIIDAVPKTEKRKSTFIGEESSLAVLDGVTAALTAGTKEGSTSPRNETNIADCEQKSGLQESTTEQSTDGNEKSTATLPVNSGTETAAASGSAKSNSNNISSNQPESSLSTLNVLSEPINKEEQCAATSKSNKSQPKSISATHQESSSSSIGSAAATLSSDTKGTEEPSADISESIEKNSKSISDSATDLSADAKAASMSMGHEANSEDPEHKLKLILGQSTATDVKPLEKEMDVGNVEEEKCEMVSQELTAKQPTNDEAKPPVKSTLVASKDATERSPESTSPAQPESSLLSIHATLEPPTAAVSGHSTKFMTEQSSDKIEHSSESKLRVKSKQAGADATAALSLRPESPSLALNSSANTSHHEPSSTEEPSDDISESNKKNTTSISSTNLESSLTVLDAVTAASSSGAKEGSISTKDETNTEEYGQKSGLQELETEQSINTDVRPLKSKIDVDNVNIQKSEMGPQTAKELKERDGNTDEAKPLNIKKSKQSKEDGDRDANMHMLTEQSNDELVPPDKSKSVTVATSSTQPESLSLPLLEKQTRTEEPSASAVSGNDRRCSKRIRSTPKESSLSGVYASKNTPQERITKAKRNSVDSDCDDNKRRSKRKRKPVVDVDFVSFRDDNDSDMYEISSVEPTAKRLSSALNKSLSTDAHPSRNSSENENVVDTSERRSKRASYSVDDSAASKESVEKNASRSSLKGTPTPSKRKPHNQDPSKKVYVHPVVLNSLADLSSTEHYHEETAYRYHNPPYPQHGPDQLSVLRDSTISRRMKPVQCDKLRPLPMSPDLPALPLSDCCEWTFDTNTRVLLANFRVRSPVTITREDEKFLLNMMERDDITIISEGLGDGINLSLLDQEYMKTCIGSHYHHKVKEFRKTAVKAHDCPSGEIDGLYEEKGWHSMKVSDYFNYLDKRQLFLHSGSSLSAKTEKTFSYTNSEGTKMEIDSSEVVLYLLDLDMVKLLPRTHENFTRNFKLPGILPGGSHCMMNSVNASGRPFMGPNVYLTPPSSFTQFHQDGHGTVDSGHFCHRGYNEVVMLRRLPERHKHHALHLLKGKTPSSSSSFLYGKPHDQESAPWWPTNEAIEECRKMGYCPSVFILKPGQLVHINKGRLHAFRKLSPSQLYENDCHYELRKAILPLIHPQDFACVSVAWDWMFKGVTSEGINREVSSILECARLNQANMVQSLAIPEISLLFLARDHLSLLKSKNSAEICSSSAEFVPDSMCVLRGILPSLQYIVHRHSMTEEASKQWVKGGTHKQVSIDPKPNTWQNPELFSMDPHGCGDFICKFCSDELSNVYMHCDGCERMLNKDFNICTSCHSQKKYKANIQMHPFNPKKKSTLNHTGAMNFERRERCPCKNGPQCDTCHYCIGCSCTCHQAFTLHYRFMPMQEELDLLKEVVQAVGASALPTSLDTKVRLFSLLSGGFEVPMDAFSTDGLEINMDTGSDEKVDCEDVADSKPSVEHTATKTTIMKDSNTGVEMNEGDTPDDSRHYDANLSKVHGETDTDMDINACPEHDGINDVDNDNVDPISQADLDGLKAKSRVIIYRNLEYWNATILKRGSGKTQGRFLIHFDGNKRTVTNWVKEEEVSRILE